MTKAVEEYKSLGDRGSEMADKIQFEIDFLSGWLPEQLSEEEVSTIIDEVLSGMGDVDMSQMGKIIGAVMAKADGLDGSLVSKLVSDFKSHRTRSTGNNMKCLIIIVGV